MQQNADAGKTKQTKQAARHHRQQLLGASADDRLIQEVRCQHAKGMPKQQEQHANVKQIAAQAQLAGAQQLRGVALPGVLVAVKADQAADQKYAEADIRVVTEQEIVEIAHAVAP